MSYSCESQIRASAPWKQAIITEVYTDKVVKYIPSRVIPDGQLFSWDPQTILKEEYHLLIE